MPVELASSLVIATYSQDERLARTALQLADLPCRKIVLRDWAPTTYLSRLLDLDADWIVHLDEDCFLTRPAGVPAIVDHMDAHGCVCCGMPDGGVVPMRRHNPVACNPFFLVLDARKLRAVRNADPDIASATWREEFRSYQAPFVASHRSRFLFDEFEPFYAFFFWLCRNSQPILYLDARQWAAEPEGISTELLDHAGTPFAVHAWFARRYRTDRPPLLPLLRSFMRNLAKAVTPRRRGDHFARIERAIAEVKRLRAPGASNPPP